MLNYTEQHDISPKSITNVDVLRLHKAWLSLRPQGVELPVGPFDVNDLWCTDDMMFLEKVAERDFYYLHYGSNIASASGFTMEGKRTSDFESPIGKFFIEKYVYALTERCPLYTTHRSIHAKGVASWERLILPLADESGEPRFLLVYNRPLAFASELLVGVLDGSPDAIMALEVTREDGGLVSGFVVELLNEKGESELGVRAFEILHQPAPVALPAIFDAAFLEKCIETVDSANRCIFEHELDLNGRTKTYRIGLSPITNGLVVTFTDITELIDANLLMAKLAMTDSLTGLANRRHFLDIAGRERKRSHRHGIPLCVLALDIDHFKQVNDRYGHDVGDEVLKNFANVLRAGVRQEDTIGRLGGEEFSVLLPETSLAKAVALGGRLCRDIASSVIHTSSGNITVTTSIGVAKYEQIESDIQFALVRADKQLYNAKKQGRNQVSSELSRKL